MVLPPSPTRIPAHTPCRLARPGLASPREHPWSTTDLSAATYARQPWSPRGRPDRPRRRGGGPALPGAVEREVTRSRSTTAALPSPVSRLPSPVDLAGGTSLRRPRRTQWWNCPLGVGRQPQPLGSRPAAMTPPWGPTTHTSTPLAPGGSSPTSTFTTSPRRSPTRPRPSFFQSGGTQPVGQRPGGLLVEERQGRFGRFHRSLRFAGGAVRSWRALHGA